MSGFPSTIILIGICAIASSEVSSLNARRWCSSRLLSNIETILLTLMLVIGACSIFRSLPLLIELFNLAF